jgi:hypothetical protein
MKRPLVLILTLLWLCSCSGKRAQDNTDVSPAVDGPTFTVNGSPRQGFAPLRVTFRGLLEGVEESNQEFYCLQEEWDFGDGAKSTEQPNCPPFSPETKIKTEFFIDHLYEKEGNYTIRVVLGDEKIRSRAITVKVVDRNIRPD